MVAAKWIGPAAERVAPLAERTRKYGIVQRASGADVSAYQAPTPDVARDPRDPDVRAALEQLAELLATRILAEIRGERSGNIATGTASERGRAIRP